MASISAIEELVIQLTSSKLQVNKVYFQNEILFNSLHGDDFMFSVIFNYIMKCLQYIL